MTIFHPYKDECTEFKRELMRIYRDLDLVEQLGSGMNRILQAYPKDVFRFSENFMEVCFESDSDYLPFGQVTGQVETLVEMTIPDKPTSQNQGYRRHKNGGQGR